MDRKFYDNEREIDLAEQKEIHKRGKQIIAGRTVIFILMSACLVGGYEGFPYCYESALVFFFDFFPDGQISRTTSPSQRFSKKSFSGSQFLHIACRRDLEETIKRRQRLSEKRQTAGRGFIHLR